jgi:hypothetical protein
MPPDSNQAPHKKRQYRGQNPHKQRNKARLSAALEFTKSKRLFSLWWEQYHTTKNFPVPKSGFIVTSLHIEQCLSPSSMNTGKSPSCFNSSDNIPKSSLIFIMIKHWKTVAKTKEGKRVALYAVTTDEAVSADLEVGRAASLILESRTLRGRIGGFTADTDHNDLASGAFCNHSRKDLNCGSAPLELVDSVPNRTPDNAVGGDGRSFFVSIWEEPID